MNNKFNAKTYVEIRFLVRAMQQVDHAQGVSSTSLATPCPRIFYVLPTYKAEGFIVRHSSTQDSRTHHETTGELSINVIFEKVCFCYFYESIECIDITENERIRPQGRPVSENICVKSALA